MTKETRVKAIVTMIGLDGHTTGGEVVARILRDAGIEVVYLGVNQTPEMIVQAAIQEDVDIIGVSSHASNYSQIEELVDLLRKKDADDIPVVCGGNIPRVQAQKLKAKGIAEVFPPGASSDEIVGFIVSQARGNRAVSATPAA
ncbi:cobalamin-dependent protein [Magnetospirillum sp. 15-1]|uniref:cobalamin B12-binding domain-containing protein n=1 Tax=Magnetospirillum sp. 15-1 TaxID=1979370 RepID=UPI000BBCD116|nr:cobalamin-dependent protein [Magnetospirillum sp. 15-1]